MNIKSFLSFIKFSEKFRSTQRSIFAIGENRMENDAEHTYQLAVLVWFIIQSENLKLNTDLAIKYALIHDLEESLTGDKDIFDEKGRKTKEKDEQIARKRIIKMFPKWKDYKTLSKNYKNLVDEESRLVNGLDKIVPVVNIYLDKGRTWKEEKTTLKMITENKRSKVNVHPLTIKIWNDIENKLTRNKSKLFPK